MKKMLRRLFEQFTQARQFRRLRRYQQMNVPNCIQSLESRRLLTQTITLALTTTGHLLSSVPGAFNQIAANVNSFDVDSAGTIYILDTTGALFNSVNGATFTQIGA